MRTPRPRRGSPCAVLLRLLVVVGLVAMHHLAGGGHLSAHAAEPGHPQVPPGMAMSQATAAGPALPVDHADSADGTALAATTPSRPSWSAALPGNPMTGLCLAVLLAGLALLVLAAGHRVTPARTGARGRRPVASPLGRGPPRLLLARLCVLRI